MIGDHICDPNKTMGLTSDSETAIEFALLSFYIIALSPLIFPMHTAPRCNCRMQSIKCECSKSDINNNFFLGEISQIVSYWK